MRELPVLGSFCFTKTKTMRKKIVEALRNRYANLGLTEKAFDGVAGMLEKTVTEESKIQDAIAAEEVSALLKSIQGESDALRTARTQAQKELEDYKKSHPEAKKPEDGSGDEGQDGNAELLKQLKSIQDRLDERDRREKSERMLSEVDRLMKQKGATNDFIRRMTLRDMKAGEGDTAETLAEKYKADYDRNFREAYGTGPTPPAGGGGAGEEFKSGEYSAFVDSLRKEGLIPEKKS